jgi:formaldehyde-activating enzyme involved in methanogenesis
MRSYGLRARPSTPFCPAKAEDRGKLEKYNYEATRTARRRAMRGRPTAEAIEQIREKML